MAVLEGRTVQSLNAQTWQTASDGCGLLLLVDSYGNLPDRTPGDERSVALDGSPWP